MVNSKSLMHTSWGLISLLALVTAIPVSNGCSRVANVDRSSTDQILSDGGPTEKRPCFLVHLNCDPADSTSVERVLNTATSLSAAKAEVILFLDLDAVILGSQNVVSPYTERWNEFFERFEKNNGATLLCPHCFEQHGLDIDQVRPGIRMTDKNELDSIEQRADMVLFGSESQDDRVPVADHGLTAGIQL